MAHKMLVLVVAVLGFAFASVESAVVQNGQCESISPMQNFDVNEFLGGWYDVAHYPSDYQIGSCSRLEFVNNTGIITIRSLMVADEQLKEYAGIARLSPTEEGVLTITFDLENGEDSVAQEYYILGTDYENYALVYSCRNLGDGTRQVFSWQLTRTRFWTEETEAAFNDIISNTEGLEHEHYQPQGQSDQDCYYIPELVPGEWLILPGLCEWMPTMEGMDYSRYMGWWYEVERYPSHEFRGQCSSIEFAPTPSTLPSYYLEATEIDVHERLANVTISRAAVENDDGSMMIYGHPYRAFRTWHILDTDYETYSLIYACHAVRTSWGWYRQVWSAKHSRQPSLTVDAQNAMRPFIEALQDLHPHLYESVDHSDSACFYYKQTIGDGEQVILPGQCDPNIPVQANFDVSKFEGTWYQIERYPLLHVNNSNTCVRTQYTVEDDGVTVQNWEVLDGVLNTNLGTATVDGASLTVTLPVRGDDETTVLQVLTTDYEKYALVYSCVNIDDSQRAIGAFKLSRDHEMSDIGVSSIEDYTRDRLEFYNPYFMRILQGEDCEVPKEPEPSSALLVKSSVLVMLFCVTLQLVMHN